MRVASYKAGSYSFGKSCKFVLWLQGCQNSCPGCIAPEWQKMAGGEEKDITEIIELILDNNREGVVISGGEPLLQYNELVSLMEKINTKHIGIILYTGFNWGYIKKKFSGILNYADMIISGPYVEKYNKGRGLIGSTNQRLHMLSTRYQSEKENFKSGERVLEIDINNDSISFCGIPPSDSNAVLIGDINVLS